MNTSTQEQYLNPDELLALTLRRERVGILKLQPYKADQALQHMVRMQERLGDTAANHFVPKDYTKPMYEPLASEPAIQDKIPTKIDAFEQALVGVKQSSQLNTIPDIDVQGARNAVALAHTQENTDAR